MAMAQELASPKVAIVEAQILIDKGEIVNAIELLKNANQQFPGNDILLILYGDALYENKQMALAEQAYMQALEINPLRWPFYSNDRPACSENGHEHNSLVSGAR